MDNRPKSPKNGMLCTAAGIFVEKTPGMESSPYLKNSDITGSGKTYTKKNPTLMTRGISEIADHEGAFHFHLTSLKPLKSICQEKYRAPLIACSNHSA